MHAKEQALEMTSEPTTHPLSFLAQVAVVYIMGGPTLRLSRLQRVVIVL